MVLKSYNHNLLKHRSNRCHGLRFIAYRDCLRQRELRHDWHEGEALQLQLGRPWEVHGLGKPVRGFREKASSSVQFSAIESLQVTSSAREPASEFVSVSEEAYVNTLGQLQLRSCRRASG